MTKWVKRLASGSLAAALACGAVAKPSYRSTVIDPPSDGLNSYPLGLNDDGAVVGFYDTTTSPELAFVHRDGVSTALGTLGGNTSRATAISRHGRVVGVSGTPSGATHAFSVRPHHLMQDLTPNDEAYAWAVNNQGQVAGQVGSFPPAQAVVIYKRAWTPLGTLGGDYSEATGINESGQVVGLSRTAGNAATRPFLYTGGGMWNLGTFGGPEGGATAVNEKGEVTGWSMDGNFRNHAFLYGAGGLHDLGLPPGQHHCYGNALNDKADVVGYCETEMGDRHAFLWPGGRNGAQAFNLNHLIDETEVGGLHLEQAVGINRVGQIAVWARRHGAWRAILLDPLAAER